ncbi:hypothetical protein FORMB_14540 [Formosa sp. Hel1_33_131]|nr:hypothetical protein [Formosa sp. Hel1_33_131]AOR28496.1 hypothetical protein FORMB_14540 [Formosa sp. Hel1_33_131]
MKWIDESVDLKSNFIGLLGFFIFNSLPSSCCKRGSKWYPYTGVFD